MRMSKLRKKAFGTIQIGRPQYFRIFRPPSALVRICQLIYTIKLTQPPLLHLLFGDPLLPTTVVVICICSLSFLFDRGELLIQLPGGEMRSLKTTEFRETTGPKVA